MTKSAHKPRRRPSTAVRCPGLRAALERAGLGPGALASALGYKRTRVQNWVSSGSVPRAELGAVTRALGVDVAVLQVEPGDPREVAFRDARVAVKEAQKALKLASAALRPFS